MKRIQALGLAITMAVGAYVVSISGQISILNTSANLSGKTVLAAENSNTITGLLTYDRDPSAPFAVSANSAVVTNLDADKLDGQEGTYYLSATNLNAGTLPDARFPSTLPALNGSALTALNATQLTTGTVPQARLAAAMNHALCECRLSLTSGTPVTTADVTAATNVYLEPVNGNRIGLYDGSNWNVYAFTEKTLALGTVTNDLPYDVFVYDNAGTPTLEELAWTSKTARATALTLQDGVLSKTGALTRRWLGTFHTTSTTTTEDSLLKRFLSNHYNKVKRPFYLTESNASWTYTTQTWRQARASTANQVAVVVGWADAEIDLTLQAIMSNGGINANMSNGIGEDSTTVPTNQIALTMQDAGGATRQNNTRLTKQPAVGYHFYAWMEYSQAANVTTWYGGVVANTWPGTSGITGWIEN